MGCWRRLDDWFGNVFICCRCGFAQSQEAYDVAVKELFDTLDMLEVHLGRCRFLCGDKLTLADVCLFTTLIRFDVVYNGLFKCTKKKLLEYPNLHAYMRDIYQVPYTMLLTDILLSMHWYYMYYDSLFLFIFLSRFQR